MATRTAYELSAETAILKYKKQIIEMKMKLVDLAYDILRQSEVVDESITKQINLAIFAAEEEVVKLQIKKCEALIAKLREEQEQQAKLREEKEHVNLKIRA